MNNKIEIEKELYNWICKGTWKSKCKRNFKMEFKSNFKIDVRKGTLKSKFKHGL